VLRQTSDCSRLVQRDWPGKDVQINPFALRDDLARSPGPERMQAFDEAGDRWRQGQP